MQILANELFAERIVTQALFKNSKVAEKRRFFQGLLRAAASAIYHAGTVRYSRRWYDPGNSRALIQVIECAIAAGFFYEYRSKKGSPKMSRLLPMPELKGLIESRPSVYCETPRQLVFLTKRRTKGGDENLPPVEIPFDPALPIVVKTNRVLARVNKINAREKITVRIYSELWREFGERQPLYPVHVRKFTDRLDLHGRIYTGEFGHQNLRKKERVTIEFGDDQSVELDYGSLHCRLLYNLHQMPVEGDPYHLWGPGTTGPQRWLAKRAVNALINCNSIVDAVSTCNRDLNEYQETRDNMGRLKMKSGQELEDARTTRKLIDETGLTFKGIVETAMRVHAPIKKFFGSDAGMKLMRVDSGIALKVMDWISKKGIPILCLHDSFIVPRSAAGELRRAMNRAYFRRTEFMPVIKSTFSDPDF